MFSDVLKTVPEAQVAESEKIADFAERCSEAECNPLRQKKQSGESLSIVHIYP